MDSKKYSQFLEESRSYLDRHQETCEKDFSLSLYHRMDYEQDTCRMVFSNTGVTSELVAEYQIVGSLSASSGTWLWSWDNPYLLDNTIEEIWDVKEFGDQNNIDALSNPKWEATLEDAWDMTAIAARILKARGAYSFLSDDIRVFVIFKSLKILLHQR